MPNQQNPREFYATPAPFVKYLLSKVPQIGGKCFEPCAGSGDIITAMEDCPPSARRRWVTNDIDKQWKTDHCADATQAKIWKTVGMVDWTVTNPAFSTFMPVLRQALVRSRVGVVLYGRISINEPLKEGVRRRFLWANPPSMILFLPRFAYRRSPTTGKWTTDSMTCCWMVWLKALAPRPDAICYAPESVIDELEAITPAYRERMDKLTRWKGYPTKVSRRSGVKT